MAWENVDLRQRICVVAPYGGPIATIRNEKVLIAVTAANFKPTLQIYTSSGEEICSFIWDKGKLVSMGWTENERLICVLQYVLSLYLYHSLLLQIIAFFV